MKKKRNFKGGTYERRTTRVTTKVTTRGTTMPMEVKGGHGDIKEDFSGGILGRLPYRRTSTGTSGGISRRTLKRAFPDVHLTFT